MQITWLYEATGRGCDSQSFWRTRLHYDYYASKESTLGCKAVGRAPRYLHGPVHQQRGGHLRKNLLKYQDTKTRDLADQDFIFPVAVVVKPPSTPSLCGLKPDWKRTLSLQWRC